MALRFERGLGEEQPFAVLRIAQRHRQRSPGHQADADLVVHLGQVQLALFAAEHVVLGLLDDGRHAVELAAVGVRFHYLARNNSIKSQLAGRVGKCRMGTSTCVHREVPQYMAQPC